MFSDMCFQLVVLLAPERVIGVSN